MTKWYKPTLTKNGYYRTTINGKRGLLHRLIMEQHLGRPLLKNEIIHHKDGNKLNNSINNLEVVNSQANHCKIHNRGITFNPNKYPKRLMDHYINQFQILPKKKYKACIFEKCGKPVVGRNFCHKHYYAIYMNIKNKD